MNALILTGSAWDALKEQSTMLVKSGFLPKGIDTAEKAIAIAMKGHEMGIPPMQAFSHIAIVQGKPCISSELMLAQIYKNVPGAKVDILKNDETEAIISAKRPGEKATTFTFTMEDARRANLTGKGTWAQYPKVMLMWRAISMMARTKFPDAIMGCSYTPEEMGAEVELAEDGQIISVKVEDNTPAPLKVGPPKQIAKPTVSEKPKVPGFYNGEKDLYEMMCVRFSQKKLPKEIWSKVGEAMLGRSLKDDFNKACDDVMLEWVESQREPMDGEELEATFS